MLFSYIGMDNDGKVHRGLIRANNRNQAIEEVKNTTPIVVITSLKETVDNPLLNNLRESVGGQIQNVQNTITERRIERDYKSLEKERTKAEKRRAEIYNEEPEQSFAGIRRAINGARLSMQARRENKANSVSVDEEIIIDEDAYQELMNVFKEREEEFGDMGQASSIGIVSETPPERETEMVDWSLIEMADDTQELPDYTTLEKFNVKVKTEEIILITRRLQVMLSAGVNMLDALTLMTSEEESDTNVMLNKIIEDIQMGSKFSEAIARFPNQFDTNYVALVAIGETSGSLEDTLGDIVVVMERKNEINKKLKSAAIYPSIIGMVLGAVMVLGSIFFIPMFEEIFTDMDGELPLLTRIVFGIADVIPFIVGGIVLAVILYGMAKRNSLYIQRKHAQFMSRMAYLIPMIKDVNNIYQMHSFASTVSLMQRNGVQLNNSLILAQKATNNVYVKSDIIRSSLLMAEGFSLSEALSQQEYFDKLLIDMVRAGEATGDLDKILTDTSDYYSDELTRKIDDLMSMVQPVSMITIGLIAGPVIIAIYMPILSMSSGGM